MSPRLQRYLAEAGVGSRRDCEDLIAAGLVTVNDSVVTAPGTRVDPSTDVVTVRGRQVRPALVALDRTCLLLNKPAGVVTTRSEPSARQTVYDYVSEPEGRRLAYIGRLDRDTTGLLLFTTLGRLAHRLAHPASGVVRRYEVVSTEELDLDRLVGSASTGLRIGDERTGRYRVEILGRTAKGEPCLAIELREGKNREVRRMISACAGEVLALERTRFGFLTLDGVGRGETRWLSESETRELMGIVDLTPEEAIR